MPQSMKACAAILFLVAVSRVAAFGQAREGAPQGRAGGPLAPPSSPRAAALADFTGQWVSLVTEDWRYRMFTAPKGDTVSIPLNPNGQKAASAWDPARDEAAGEQCKAYGAAGIMRMPTRMRIAWQDDNTLKVELDAGSQIRLLRFGTPAGEAGSWQGMSIASWEYPRAIVAARGFGPGPAAGPPPGGSMKVVTTRVRPGYIRRNGVPYSANAVMTEYFDRLDVPGGDSLLIVAAEVVDPEYLSTPYWTSTQFKRQSDASSWNPTPCVTR
jgi:hypothetical protein